MTTPDRIERELLSAYREGERMPAAVRTAAWSRLQAAIHADALHEELAPERRAPVRRPRWGVVLLAAAALLVLIAGLRGRAERAHEASDNQAVHATDEPRPQAPALRGPPPAPSVVAPSTSRIEPPATTPARGPTRSSGPDVGLDAELALLRGARAALAAGTGAEALTLLDEHERKFLTGHLAEERMVLRVQALCAVDRRDEARAAAARFAAQRPGSPHAATITAICTD